MNKKHSGCIVKDCKEPHRRNGYCTNHSQKAKRGTLETYPHSKLCTHPGCFKKYYASGYCIMHRQRKNKNLPMDMQYDTKFRRQKIEIDLKTEFKSKESWSLAVKNIFGDNCMICGWKETTCDTHHIIHYSKGGPNILENGVVLCPNHHRMAHKKLISKEQLQEYNTKAIKTLTEVEPPKEIECQFGQLNH